jgi:hypothetical protein
MIVRVGLLWVALLISLCARAWADRRTRVDAMISRKRNGRDIVIRAEKTQI